MGGFYGSVQIRTNDRARVVVAAASAAKTADIRCLVGPSLNGWVGVYPEGAGQDRSVGETIAREVGGDCIQLVVHDDVVMAYWLWHDGELDDTYWSAPGFFNALEKKSQLQMTGDPQAFGPLMTKPRAEVMMKILDRERVDVGFEATRLQQFAELMGIRNAVTSYEYLKSGERLGIEDWEGFSEVPSEAVAAERAAQRERRHAIAGKKQKLMSDYVLFADVVEDRLLPNVCAVAGGFLVAWEGFGRADARIDFYRPPWGEAEPGEIETGGQVNCIAADAVGKRFAMALGNRVVVWDSDGWNPILELVEDDWATQAALSADGRLLAYASRQFVFVHDIDSGQRVTSLRSHDGKALAFHPDGQWLVSAGTALWIASISGKDPWRELYPGGQVAFSAEQTEAVKKEMARVNLDAMEQKWRASIESAVQKLASSGQDSASTQQMVAKMRDQMEKQLHQMREKFLKLKEGNIPAPRHGNESALCAGFTSDGTRLWLGTDKGLRIYDWNLVVAAEPNTSLPKPLLSHDPLPPTPRAFPHGLIYAAVEIPGRNAMLFGGYPGKICHFDLKTGDVRELLTPPDGGAIVSLAISREATAVSVCSRPALGEFAVADDERAVWQIWSYAALLGKPIGKKVISPEIVIDVIETDPSTESLAVPDSAPQAPTEMNAGRITIFEADESAADKPTAG